LNLARTLQNSVVLPNGEVFTVGGMCKSLLFSDECAHLIPEIWNPNTGNWRQLAAMQVPRTYHSVALLMQDGRVWVAGGGLCGDCAVNHNDAEIYSPPYLFQGDAFAPRPVINTVPGSAFVLIRLSSPTHAVNNEQRRIPLTSVNNGGNNYTVNIPGNDWLPPGNYFLFAMDNGVPSVGKTINIGGNAPGGGQPGGGDDPVAGNGEQLVVNGTYYIESLPTKQHLASPEYDRFNIRMLDQGTGDDQKWEITHIDNNVYNIKNIRSSRYMTVAAGECKNGTTPVPIIQDGLFPKQVTNISSSRYIVTLVPLTMEAAVI